MIERAHIPNGKIERLERARRTAQAADDNRERGGGERYDGERRIPDERTGKRNATDDSGGNDASGNRSRCSLWCAQNERINARRNVPRAERTVARQRQ